MRRPSLSQPRPSIHSGAAQTVFSLRREPLYHKLQYSKVPKFDAAAAALGVIVGAFTVYLGLSSLGSAGADLTDLTTVCWYAGVWLGALRGLLSLCRDAGISPIAAPVLGLTFCYETGAALLSELRRT